MKNIWQNVALIWNKNKQKRIRGNFLKMIKDIYIKPILIFYLVIKD